LMSILEAQFDPVTQADLQVLDELQADHLSQVDEWGDAYILYELVP
jgi:hypothetical protein